MVAELGDAIAALVVRLRTSLLLTGRGRISAAASAAVAAAMLLGLTGESGAEQRPPRTMTPVPPPPPSDTAPPDSPGNPSDRDDSTLAPLLSQAAAYLSRFTAAFSNVVATERYVQDITGAGGLLSRTEPATMGPRHRELRSDLVLVRSAGPLGWQMFRDVFEVDGTSVGDRTDRLARLFEEGTTDAREQASRIARESARYNIGAAERTINSPMVALLFLQADQQPRFVFSRGTRTGSFSDRVDVVAFHEVARPTVIRTVQDTDRPASGRVWIEQDTGTILQTELVLAGHGISVRFTTMFRHEESLGLAIPYRLEEEYLLPSGRLTGVATYDRFRRFTVRTDTAVSPAGTPR